MNTFAEYQQAAARTAGADTKPFEIHLMISTLGLCGEAAEVLSKIREWSKATPAEVVDELGDYTWYCADLARLLGLRLEYPAEFRPALSLNQQAANLGLKAGRVADHVKKVIGHDHAFHVSFIETELQEALMIIAGLGVVLGYTLPEICKLNIEKLNRRYPAGFSVEASRERVTE